MQIHELSAVALRAALDARELSAVEVARHSLERIAADETRPDRTNAFIETWRDEALAAASAADARLAAGERAPLLGLPVALKDNLNLKGRSATCASRILEGYRAAFTATAVGKLEDGGAVFVGRTNMDEFAMGSSTETSVHGIARNPADRERIPGGSSGGSAAAVAAGFVPLALGSDTGGSIRQPASLCGVVGMKPTYGRVSRNGLIAFASSLDQIGPFAADVAGAALLLGAIAGHDPLDSTSVDMPVPDYTQDLDGDLRGRKIGVPQEYFAAGIDPAVEASVRAAITTLRELGAEIVDISLPHTGYAVPIYYIVATAEASSNLARFDGVRYGFRDPAAGSLQEVYNLSRAHGFGPEVKRRILLGTYVLSSGYYDAYYLKALKARTLLKRDFESAFAAVDAIVTPTTPTPAFKIGEKADDPVSMYLSDIFTTGANLAGIPGLSLPCGKTGTGLPIGVQLLGKPFDEHGLLKVAYRLERALAG